MEENNNTHPNQSETTNPNQPIAEVTPIISDSVNSIPEQETAAQQTNEPTQVVPEPIKVIIDRDNRKSTAPRIANIIAGVSIIISAVMFYYTFRLFGETKRANNIADSNYHLAKAAFDSSNKSGKDNYDLAKNTFGEQIKSFKIANEPFLQLKGIQFIQFKTGVPTIIYFSITNLGNYPAKILQSKVAFVTKVVPPTLEKYETFKANVTEMNRYVGKGGEEIITLENTENLLAGNYDRTTNGNFWGYLFGYIKYQNLQTKSIKLYSFMIQVKQFK